jgi:hypothetical protein
MVKLNSKLIAPCGMNCGVCRAHLREKEPCPGCYNPLPRYKACHNCKLKNCKKRKGLFCYACPEFPCQRLKHLDKRYRTKYGMSEIKNLEFIRDKGIKKFLESETKKYISPKGILCVHDKKRYGQ